MIKLYPNIILPVPPIYLRNDANYITVDQLRKEISIIKNKIKQNNISYKKLKAKDENLNKLTLHRKARYLANILEPTVLKLKFTTISKISKKPKNILTKTARITIKDNTFKVKKLPKLLSEYLTYLIKKDSKNRKLLKFYIHMTSKQPNFNEYIVNIQFDHDSISLKKILRSLPTKLQVIDNTLSQTELNPAVYSQLLRLKGLDPTAAREITKMLIDPSYHGR